MSRSVLIRYALDTCALELVASRHGTTAASYDSITKLDADGRGANRPRAVFVTRAAIG